MDELEKIVRVMKKVEPDAPHAVLLVLDATVGQNALSQVEMFRKIAGVTGLVMTKLDGTARGGILVAIADEVRPAGAFHRRRRGHRRSAAVHGARFRPRHWWIGQLTAMPAKAKLNPGLKLVLDLGPLVCSSSPMQRVRHLRRDRRVHGRDAGRAGGVLCA